MKKSLKIALFAAAFCAVSMSEARFTRSKQLLFGVVGLYNILDTAGMVANPYYRALRKSEQSLNGTYSFHANSAYQVFPTLRSWVISAKLEVANRIHNALQELKK